MFDGTYDRVPVLPPWGFRKQQLGGTEPHAAGSRDTEAQPTDSRPYAWCSEQEEKMNKRAWAMTAPLVVVVALLVASCGDNSPTPTDPGPLPSVVVTAATRSITALLQTLQLEATLIDADGNEVSGVSFTWRSEDTSVITVSDVGLATAIGNGSTRVLATTDGVSSGLRITVEQSASQLAVRTQPSGAVLGQPLTAQPVVEVQDANANLVSGDHFTVVVAAIGAGGGTLAGTVSAKAVRGVITFTDLTIAGSVGGRTLVFEPSSSLTSVTSSSFELLPGAADAVLPLTGDGQAGKRGKPLQERLVVVVTDSDGHPASGEAPVWSVAPDAGSIQAVSPTTDAHGLSKAIWTLGTALRGNTVTATVAGKSGATFAATIDPEPLTLVGSGLTPASEAPLAGVYVHGNYAFVGGTRSGYYTSANIGVRIVDLSNPANPVHVGRIPLRGTGDAVATHINSGAFQGDVAIVLNGVPDRFGGPQPHGIWDVTNPSNPTFLSVLNLGNASNGNAAGDLGNKPYDGKAVAGNYFYAIYNKALIKFPGDYRLAVVDISDPGNPVVVGDWQDNSDASNDVWLLGLSLNESGTRAYITGLTPAPYNHSSTHGYLYILDIQDPSQPTEIGRYVFPVLGTPSSVSIARPTSDDALVVLADHSWGLGTSSNEQCGILHMLDTSNPAAINEISTFALPRSSSPSTCTGDGNWVIATDLAIRGNLVYSTWLRGGVRAIDISDPTNPVEVAWFGRGDLSDVALLGTDFAVATTVWESGMYVLSMP